MTVAKHLGAVLLGLSVFMTPTQKADAQNLHVMRGSVSSDLKVAMNRAVVVESDTPFAELSIANPTIADISTLSDRTIYVLGKTPGRTTLTLLGPDGRLITNVEVHVASAYDLPLDDESVDRAFLVTVLPEIPDRARALAELRRVLKPGSVLSITEEFLDPDHLFAFETVRHVEEAWFRLERRFGNLWLYTLNFALS